jgi:hypothetical protein
VQVVVRLPEVLPQVVAVLQKKRKKKRNLLKQRKKNLTRIWDSVRYTYMKLIIFG